MFKLSLLFFNTFPKEHRQNFQLKIYRSKNLYILHMTPTLHACSLQLCAWRIRRKLRNTEGGAGRTVGWERVCYVFGVCVCVSLSAEAEGICQVGGELSRVRGLSKMQRWRKRDDNNSSDTIPSPSQLPAMAVGRGIFKHVYVSYRNRLNPLCWRS